MRVLVLLGLGADVRIPPECDPRSGRIREEWLVREVDPGSGHALDLALGLKAAWSGVQVTVMHLGPSDSEAWLRRALARGADDAVRIWDAEIAGPGGSTVAGGPMVLHVAAKAVILAAAAQAAGFDLVLCGAAGVIDAGGQLGPLLAARLGLPCVTQVVDVVNPDLADDGAGDATGPVSAAAPARLELTRALDQGFRERVEAHLPVIVTITGTVPAGGASNGVAPAERHRPPAVTASALLGAQSAGITVWDLADLGVPAEDVRRAAGLLRYSRPRPRRPRLRLIAAPDPALPAFDRILQLIQGSVQQREGRVVRKTCDETVEEIFRTLRDEGWLDHLRPGPRSPNVDIP